MEILAQKEIPAKNGNPEANDSRRSEVAMAVQQNQQRNNFPKLPTILVLAAGSNFAFADGLLLVRV